MELVTITKQVMKPDVEERKSSAMAKSDAGWEFRVCTIASCKYLTAVKPIAIAIVLNAELVECRRNGSRDLSSGVDLVYTGRTKSGRAVRVVCQQIRESDDPPVAKRRVRGSRDDGYTIFATERFAKLSATYGTHGYTAEQFIARLRAGKTIDDRGEVFTPVKS